jgi:HEAT repeat protein
MTVIEFIRSNFQIVGICALVLVLLIARIIVYLRGEKRDRSEEARRQGWKAVIDRCRNAGSFVLRDREIARFSVSGWLRAFGDLCETTEAEACSAIIRDNSKKLIARVGSRADNAEKGYFAYVLFVSDLSGLTEAQKADYSGFLRHLLSNHSVFCRENALKALYNLGDAVAVADAVETLSADARLHNEKLLSDGMNSFRGDRRALAEALMERFARYDDHSQSAVITFFTVADFHDWDEQFKQRLERADISVDQRCDILRLILRRPSEETKKLLIDVVLDKGKAEDWQTAAVAATGLERYPDDGDVVNALEYGITSPAWNVRMNCAGALVRLNPPEAVLNDILNGGDAFAADALKFALSSNGTESA